MHRLCELDKEVRAWPVGKVMQPATAPAELGREGLTGKQVRPGAGLEEIAYRAGSPVHLDRYFGGVARMRHVGVEGDFGAAMEKRSRGIVVKVKRARRP